MKTTTLQSLMKIDQEPFYVHFMRAFFSDPFQCLGIFEQGNSTDNFPTHPSRNPSRNLEQVLRL